MRTSPWRRAAAAGLTLGIAALVAGVIAGAGWGIQRAGLRAPTQGERIAARAVGVMLRFRYVESEVRIVGGGGTRQAQCLQGWQPRGKGRPGGRGGRVLYEDGESLLLGDRRVRRLRPGKEPARLRPLAEVELAGCPRPMSDRLSAKLVDGTRPAAVASSWEGRRAYRVHVRFGRTRFDLYIDHSTLVPLGVRVEERGVIAWSRVNPIPLTPKRKQAFLRAFNG